VKACYLVCWDITAPGRARQVRKAARRFALGGTKSAMECWLTAWEKKQLCKLMYRLINPEDDQLFVLHISAPHQTHCMGRALIPGDNKDMYLG
jgi:CRISPR-associated protein Cas2